MRNYENESANYTLENGLFESQRQFAIDQHAILSHTNTTGAITYANTKFCEISKYSKEEIIGKNHRIINSNYHPKDFFMNMYSDLKNGKTWYGDIRNRAKDGSIFWVATTIVPLKDSSGNIFQYFSSQTDITARKQIEEELRANQKKLEIQNAELQKAKADLRRNHNIIKAITDNIPGMVGYWTSDLKCAFANKHYLTWFGRTMEQMQGIRMQDLLGEKLFQANEPYIRGALEGEQQRFERTLIKPNGQVTYTYAQYIPDISNGEVNGFYALVLDITEVKKGQESLLESEMRYRGLLTNIEAGVVVYYPDTSIKMHNARAVELLGINESQMDGKPLTTSSWNCLDSNSNRLSLEEYPVNRILKTKKPIKNNIYGTHHHSSKEILWLSVNGFPSLNKEGEISEIVVSFVDITARKKAELFLQQRTLELEFLNATKDKFFNIIAHDLRNPFAGIKALSEFMESKLIQSNKEEDSVFLKYSQMIISSSDSALSLINNLIQWAQSQRGEIIVNYETISFNSLLFETIPIVNPNAINKNINIEQKLSSYDLVYADESLISTILRNILTNAIKFTRSNGKIIVSSESKNGFLEVSINDSGVGIEPENIEKIFSIDSKFSKRGTENEKGTGLGLILCKEFVEMLGGKISVTSEIGVGSTFTFTLPLANAVE
ncbi:MAG: PAS domain-containing sensor histidine kinase [Leptospiraceae bacterium]|nr:PAS domain-containing sensor histidine kinase [Leptospiraceae bacterium]